MRRTAPVGLLRMIGRPLLRAAVRGAQRGNRPPGGRRGGARHGRRGVPLGIPVRGGRAAGRGVRHGGTAWRAGGQPGIHPVSAGHPLARPAHALLPFYPQHASRAARRGRAAAAFGPARGRHARHVPGRPCAAWPFHHRRRLSVSRAGHPGPYPHAASPARRTAALHAGYQPVALLCALERISATHARPPHGAAVLALPPLPGLQRRH